MIQYKGYFLFEIMSVPKDQNLQTLSESPEEAQKRAQLDREFELRWETADFRKAAEGSKQALGGIWELAPEDGKERARAVLSEEALAEEEPELDLSAFDGEEITANTGAEKNPLSWVSEETPENKTQGAENSLTPTRESWKEYQNTQSPEAENKENETFETPLSVECEYAPLIEQFTSDGKLDPMEAKALIEKDINAQNFKEVIEVCDIVPEKKQELIASLSYLTGEAHEKKSQTEIRKDFPDMIASFQVPGTQGEKTEFSSPVAEEAFKTLAGHYIGGKPEWAAKEADMDLAFSMAANTIGNAAKLSLNTWNREMFQQALITAKSTTLPWEDRFAALVTLAQIKNTDQGAKGWYKNKEKQRMQIQEALTNAGKLGEFQALQAQLRTAHDAAKPQKNIAEIQKQIDAIKLAAGLPEDTGDGGMGGGKIDMQSEIIKQAA